MDENNSTDIAITVSSEDTEIRDALLAASEMNAEAFPTLGFDNANLVTIIVSATSATMGVLATLIRAHYDRCKSVKVEIDGVKVQAANPDEIVTILETVLKERKKKHTK